MAISVHVVKGHQCSAHIRYPLSQRWHLRLILDLEVTKLVSITEINLTAQYGFQSSDQSGHGRCAIIL